MIGGKRHRLPVGGEESGRSKLRLPSRACYRCRSLHKKCNISVRNTMCSRCEMANVLCRGGGSSELQIRFCDLSHLAQSPASDPEHELFNEEHSTVALFSDHGSEDQQKPSTPKTALSIVRVDFERTPVTASSAQPLQQLLKIPDPATSRRSSSLTGVITSRSSESSPPQLHPDSKSVSHNQFYLLAKGFSLSQSSEADSLIGTPLSEHDLTSVSLSGDAGMRHVREATSSPWPLNDQAIKLVKHFFAVLIPLFDYCDARGHFRSYIQSTLHDNLGILFAVLAVSARHLESIGSEYYNSNDYEHECLSILIPSLNNDVVQSSDDTALVSALLLRLLEEMTDSDERRSAITHTVSAPLLLQITLRSDRHSELKKAAMAVALRQEIYVANTTGRPVELTGHDCGIEESLEPASDPTWTFRMMSHAARVTNYVYGNEPRSQEVWDQLWQYLEDWGKRKPTSFNPLNQVDSASFLEGPLLGERHNIAAERNRVFPRIYYAYDCPIAGQQYLQLCKVLLLASDPRTPAIGLGRTKYITAQEESIRAAVRNICGIYLSNPEYTAARVLASLAIGMAGELFTEPSETIQLLKIVSEAELHVKWLSLKVGAKLKELWELGDINCNL